MISKGQKINDRYEIIKSIGEGGMANVYLGYDSILDRNVAIKVLRGDLSNDEKFVRRFQREAIAASSLAHRNIVEVYDVGEDDGMYYIVMEYIKGKTLKQLLKKRGSLTLSEALDIMLQLIDGMSHAHDSYIIHRDLKPQNIMIKDDGQIKITDFGIAMALNATQLTQTNSVMGSVHYLPPEQASGKGSTFKSDIYSMGIIFYELLSGNLPFKGDNAVEIALKHMREPFPSIREENSSIPQSIENIILKATAKNPKNRYNSAKEMHDDLLTALDDDRIDEKKIEFEYPEHEEVRKKKVKDVSSEEENKLNDKETKEEEIASEITDKKMEDLEAEEDAKTSKKLSKATLVALILSIIFVAILFVILAIIFLYPKTSNKAAVTVPSCVGLKVSSCEKKLQSLGFDVNTKIESIPSTDVKKNRVVKTDPEKGRSVKSGTQITIYKSTGEETFTLENYVGRNYIEVQTFLETKYDLKVTIEKKEVESSENFENDVIMEQSIKEGEKVKAGDKIILYIPDLMEKFPNMQAEGWTIDDAQAFAKKYQLTLETDYQETSAYDEGKILSQSRAAGTEIVKETTLKVTVAKKPTEKKPTCKTNESYNSTTKSCECVSGYEKDSSGTCVKKEENKDEENKDEEKKCSDYTTESTCPSECTWKVDENTGKGTCQ